MKLENLIRVMAGTMVLIGTALGVWVHTGWLLLPAFVGINLIQSAFTGFCPPSLVLGKLGWITADGRVVRPRGGPGR